MPEEQRQLRLLGQKYLRCEDETLAASIFKDQHGAFAWHLWWWKRNRPETQYYFDKGEFFEVIELDNDGHWKKGEKLSGIDPLTEARMREAVNTWEKELRDREK